ncbi:hypothetical protein ABPG75_012605 [Micractinium tetrahymenae]
MALPHLRPLLLVALLGCAGLVVHGLDDATLGRARRKLQGGPVAAAAAAAAAAGARRRLASGGSDPIEGQIAFGTVAARKDFPYIARLLYDDDTWYGCGGTLVRGRAVVTACALPPCPDVCCACLCSSSPSHQLCSAVCSSKLLTRLWRALPVCCACSGELPCSAVHAVHSPPQPALLAAAHCFFVDGGQPDDPLASVRIGVVNAVTDRLGVDYQQRRVVKTIIHPLYQPASDSVSTWDVAVIILDRPVNLTKSPPAVLTPLNMPLPAGLPLWAAGWGQTQDASESAVLRKAQLPVVDRVQCADYLGSLEFEHMCAGGALTRQDTCSGDSGGPLVLKRQGKPDILVGVTSYGPSDIRCGAVNGRNIGAYTFIGNRQIRDWLLKVFAVNRV